MICFRLLDSNDPAQPLADAVRALASETASQDTYEVEPASFRHIPNAPFAYWVSEKIRKLFVTLPPFENEERTATVGLQTGDDFRFVRIGWESPVNQSELTNRTWFHFAKGGSYSPFYADVFLKVNWHDSGLELDTFAGSVLRNTNYYFRPGLTWPRRTTSGMSLRVMPANCVFGDKGPAIFMEGSDSASFLTTLTIILSQPCLALISLQLAAADAAARSYEVGVIQRTVIPNNNDNKLPNLATHAWQNKRKPDTANLTSHAFVAPALAPSRVRSTPDSK
ncbi:MAG: hypothetical protein KJO21_01135 [Verrucomicrobiae bacterium]|nr:hypothetical protein [Verrucomicrobiae bacterium]NNJ42138.1 hypothetical protein [Akkermansiaceae bacterium]